MRTFIPFNAISRQFETLRKSAKLSCHPNISKNCPFFVSQVSNKFCIFCTKLTEKSTYFNLRNIFRQFRTFSQAKCSFQPYPTDELHFTVQCTMGWRERVSQYPSPGVLVKSWVREGRGCTWISCSSNRKYKSLDLQRVEGKRHGLLYSGQRINRTGWNGMEEAHDFFAVVLCGSNPPSLPPAIKAHAWLISHSSLCVACF